MKKPNIFKECVPGSQPGSAVLIGALLLNQTLGALVFPIAKYGLAIIEPFTFAFYRFMISTLVLLAVVRLDKKPDRRPIEKKDYLKIFGLGVLIIPLNQTAYLFGQSLTGAGHGALLYATVPIWIFLGGLVFLKEKLILRRATGVALGLGGVGIIMGAGAVELGSSYLLGDIIILLGVLAWAGYTIFGQPLVVKYGALRLIAYSLAAGTALYFPYGAYRALTFDYSPVTAGAWFSVIYAALGVSVVAYLIWYWLLKYMETTRMAVFHNLQPVIAAAAAFIFLGESIGWHFITGGVTVLAGVIITEK
jgi:drug/metabolite transporter (DMT)-like permease